MCVCLGLLTPPVYLLKAFRVLSLSSRPGSSLIFSRTDYKHDPLRRETLFPGQPNGEEMVVASIVRKTASRIYVSFETKFEELENGYWRYVERTSTSPCFKAG